ncbi:tRNA U34 5-methylaminomethyl-2-thiouridine-forming methyltransferase MnmC [Loktanella ponticola]|uniref:tRNA U34 5-methylaminomethyl-2-thiouridine-forming methyltransferase MnmC n=1 Tax=Yoonia ponticola TaxID=1524255 RepID=A0A7W9BLW9_9RHOB|nr:tRNA (5-methylaminomethyl-2-thiouridine)(34)-methyltransferase MnmD [Yoonia ponticola]MBB5722901.1 tRNA U34 5-methylaminomethyl-2-thiouridine-forming methyltransferase MnmC [Yoonia ponticola]
MRDQTTDLTWRKTDLGDVPISTQFDDPYYSLDNGLAETRHVFLDGNDLPARFGDHLHIGELGFGTGLNFLTTVQTWITAGRVGTWHFTSFEAFPLDADTARTALAAFPELGDLTDPLLDIWNAAMLAPTIYADGITLEVITGDVRQTLPAWQSRADAWFLDGFSPAKNPEMWEPDVMQAVGDHTTQGGTLATYTAAGHVRRSLETAGFTVTRATGFGRKRHMTRAVKAS